MSDKVKVRDGKLSEFRPTEGNPNQHTQRGLWMLAESMEQDGYIAPLTVAADGESLDGSARLETAFDKFGDDALIIEHDGTRPVVMVRTDIADAKSPRARRIIYRVNRSGEADLEWSAEQLLADLEAGVELGDLWRDDELAALVERALDEDGAGGSGDGDQPEPAPRQTLAERFVVPPFSVLDARQGYWQERKRAWISLGIRGELGRSDTCLGNGAHSVYTGASPRAGTRGGRRGLARSNGQDLMKGENPNFAQTDKNKAYKSQRRQAALQKTGDSRAVGQPVINSVFGRPENAGNAESQTGTSIFDPVLCEVVYRWFTPTGGRILDPFAGEATKGIVATYLGYQYTGMELRQEQVEANQSQAKEIGVSPVWVCGDSANLLQLLPAGEEYDLIFTSPPYYDLEIYSESEKDGSAFETYEIFMGWYHDIFEQAVGRLKDNRFLVVKIGEIRDERGIYRNFVGDNISCFLDLGLNYYNEAILVTAVGSLPVRVGRQFAGYRKLGKTHQNILVFYKGDPRTIKDEFPDDIECADIFGEEAD